jgi:hypothetical protein
MKEKTMANKKFWLGMLVMILALGMTVIGCDNGSGGGGGGNPFVGTWKSNPPSNGVLTLYADGTGTYTGNQSVSYTYSGSTAQITLAGNTSPAIIMSDGTLSWGGMVLVKQ